jgi:hypothetical protein
VEGKKVPRKDRIVDVPMTAWWFEGLRIGLNQKRPYGVEKLVEPEVFKKVKSGYSHTNKWRVYKSGLRLPRASLIEKAEAVLPGSSADFSHPIWKVGRLKEDQSIAGLADEWLHQLNLDLLPLLFRVDQGSGKEIRRGVSNPLLQKLIYRADLDALAALSILLRESAEKHQYKLTMAVGGALYKGLLHAAVRGSEQIRIVLPKIFEMLVERVFPLARNRLYCYSFEGLDIPAFCKLFLAATDAKRELLRLRHGELKSSDVDSIIFPGIVRPFGFLHFLIQPRPIVLSREFSDAEENFQALLSTWKAAISVMQNLTEAGHASFCNAKASIDHHRGIC